MTFAQLKLLLATISIISVFAGATMYRFMQDRPIYVPVTKKYPLPMVDLRESITLDSPRKRLPNAANTDREAQRSSPFSTATSTQPEPTVQHQITPRLAPPS